MPQMQELFLPIHNYVKLFPEEVAIINLPIFQRLRRCRQLGFAHFLFPGATHTRFEHSIGTLHVAQRMVDAVNDRHASEQNGGNAGANGNHQTCLIDEPTQRLIRLAALLHDIGHIPFGHTFEDELHHLDNHDGPTRIREIADKGAQQYTVNPELKLDLTNPDSGWTLRQLVDKAYYRIFSEFIKDHNRDNFPTPFEILEFVISKPPEGEKEKNDWQARRAVVYDCIPLEVCRDIVGNTICADFLDYLFRDWYHLGKLQVEDPRLYHYMEVRSNESDSGDLSGQKFVINIGQSTSPRHDAITNILDLLESRYKLAETVLFHRTKLSLTAILDRCVLEIRRFYKGASGNADWERELKSSLVKELLDGSDDTLPDILRRVAFGDSDDHPCRMALKAEETAALDALQSDHKNTEDQNGTTAQPTLLSTGMSDTAANSIGSAREHANVIENLILAIQDRQVYTRIFRFGKYDFTGTDIESELTGVIKLYQQPDRRSEYLTNLEVLCGLPSGCLAMYCSIDAKMNAKIAEVNLLIDDNIKSFKKYEADAGDVGLTGGTLNAQVRRFQALWSAQLFMHRDVWSHLDQNARQDLRQVIRDTFLPISLWGRDVSNLMHHRNQMESRISNVKDKFTMAAARSGTEEITEQQFVSEQFPNGLPCATLT